MFMKTLLTAAAAIAVFSGATAISANTAEAGYYGHSYKRHWSHSYVNHYPRCYTKYRTVKISYKTWDDYLCRYVYKTKYVKRPYNYCH